VFDVLAFLKVFERSALDGRMVEEQLTAVSADEPKTTIRDQLLNDTLRHDSHSLKRKRSTSQTVVHLESKTKDRDGVSSWLQTGGELKTQTRAIVPGTILTSRTSA